MSKFNSTKGIEQETIRKIAHPALGEIYCLNEPETRMVLDEIFVDKLYFREGIFILPGDIVFDVGANIGVFTLCAAQHGAEVYAYEPIPATFGLLQQNIHLHGYDKTAQAINIGLSDRAEDKIMFHYPTVADPVSVRVISREVPVRTDGARRGTGVPLQPLRDWSLSRPHASRLTS